MRNVKTESLSFILTVFENRGRHLYGSEWRKKPENTTCWEAS